MDRTKRRNKLFEIFFLAKSFVVEMRPSDVIKNIDCSLSPIFPWDFRDSFASIELPPSRFVTAGTIMLAYKNERDTKGKAIKEGSMIISSQLVIEYISNNK